MSIEYDNSLFDDEVPCYTPVCDYCGDSLPAEFDFYDAVNAKKAAGWKSIKDNYGDWTDACPECAKQFYASPTSAADDFAEVGKG